MQLGQVLYAISTNVLIIALFPRPVDVWRKEIGRIFEEIFSKFIKFSLEMNKKSRTILEIGDFFAK